MISLTPSHIIQYLYCPRFTYFEHVLAVPQHEEKNYKVVRGRELHDARLEQNKGYLRRRLGVVEKWEDQYLTNELLRGRIDEVLRLDDGTFAPLDYKFAEYKDRIFSTYRTQLYCYAWLIETNFAASVMRGYLVYTRSRNRVVPIDIRPEDTQHVRKAATAIAQILESNRFPKATPHKRKCLSCTYRNVCVR